MAGQGKGVLRIAIEDFFTTTKIGLWLAGWFKDFGEAQETAIYNSYKNINSVFDSWIADPANSIPHSVSTSGTPQQGGIMSAVGFASQIGMGAASGLLAPVMRLLNYSMDKKYQSARLDPSALIQLYFRDPTKAQAFFGDATELGWSGDRFGALRDALKPLLNITEIITMYHRSLITEAEARKEIMKIGFDELDANRYLEIGKVIPNVQDLISMAVREAFSPDVIAKFQYLSEFPSDVTKYTAMQGLSTEWVQRYWAAHWQLPSISQGYEMLHRLRPGRTPVTFVDSDMDLLLKTADVAPYFRERLKKISYAPYTRVDVRRMYKAGVIDENEIKQTYMDLGYDEVHAQNLTDFTIKWATGEDSSLADKQADLTESLLSNMFAKGIIDEATFRAELSKLTYPSQYIDWLVKYSVTKRTTDTTPDEYNTYQSKMKSEVLAAYGARQITQSEATLALSTAGFQPQAITWLLQTADYDFIQGTRNNTIGLIHDSYTSKIMNRTQAVTALGQVNVSGAEQTQLLATWDNELQYRTKRLSESDYTKALTLGIISQDKYIEDLQGLGLSDDDITVKLALFQAAQTDTQADAKALELKAQQTAAKKVSVTDLLDAYAKGAISQDTLYTRLQTAGFTTDDIALLVSTRYNAPKPELSKLTAAQILTAYKRGAISEQEVYTMLTARGYTTDDIDILLASQPAGATT